jgi:hypothetical protein
MPEETDAARRLVTAEARFLKRWVVGAVIGAALVFAGIGAFVVISGLGRTTTTAIAGVVAEPAPAPDLAAVLHANYRVLSTSSVSLTGGPVPETIVVSAGPGLDPANPVDGGTENVQLLVYDKLARRWNVAFDAASNVLPADYSQPEPKAHALLDQAHTITDVAVTPLRMTKDAVSQLLIFGRDGYYNHPVGMTAIVRFDSATPLITWSDEISNAVAPVGSGPPGTQMVSLTAGWVTSADPACCPARQFTRQVGARTDGIIGVLSDDRPWLGAWIASASQSSSSPRDAVVVETVPNSPADAVLRVGDHVVGLVGAAKPTNTTLDLDVVDQIAVAHPGDKVVLSVRRGRTIELPVTLGSYADPSAQSHTAPIAGYLGVQMVSAPAGAPQGALIASVTPGTPAARAGLAPGQLIQAVGDVPIADADGLSAALFGRAGQTVALAVTVPQAGGSINTMEGLSQALAGGQKISVPVTIAAYPTGLTPTMFPSAL